MKWFRRLLDVKEGEGKVLEGLVFVNKGEIPKELVKEEVSRGMLKEGV